MPRIDSRPTATPSLSRTTPLAPTPAPVPGGAMPNPMADAWVATAERLAQASTFGPLQEDEAWRTVRNSPSSFESLPLEARGSLPLVRYVLGREASFAAYIDPKVWDVPGFALEQLQKNPTLYASLPEDVRARPELIREVLRTGAPMVLMIPPEALSNRTLAQEAVAKEPALLGALVPEPLKADVGLLRVARQALLEGRGTVDSTLGYLPQLAGDEAVVRARLTKAPGDIAFVDPTLWRSPRGAELAKATVLAKDANLLPGGWWSVLPPEVRSDPTVAALAIRIGGLEVMTAEEIRRPELRALAAPASVALYPQLPPEWQALPEMAAAWADHAPLEVNHDTGKLQGPLLLEAIPEALRSDRALMAKVLLRDGRCFEQLPEALRNDPQLASIALAQDGSLIRFAGPKVLADAQCLANALRSAPHAVTLLPEALREDPKVWERALKVDGQVALSMPADLPGRATLMARYLPRALTLADATANAPGWGSRPKDVLQLLAHFGAAQVAPHVDAALWKDRAFAEQALVADPTAFAVLAPALQKSPKLQSLAARDPRFYALWNPGFTPKREDVLVALEKDPSLYSRAPSWRGDRQATFTALCLDASQLKIAPPELQNDLELLGEAAAVNPLLVWELGPTRQAQLFAASPKAKASWESLSKTLEGLNITQLERFHGDWRLLREIIDVRKSIDVPDGRPLATVVYGKEDWNGGLGSGDTLAKLRQGHRVAYFEAETDVEAMEAVRRASRAQPTDLLVLGGHGDQNVTALGGSDPRVFGSLGGPSRSSLDLHDAQLLRLAGLRDCLAPGGNLVLVSCSTGRGLNLERNMANLFAQAVPQVTVWAPNFPTNVDFRVDAAGRFVEPGFMMNGGAGIGGGTYRVPPRG